MNWVRKNSFFTTLTLFTVIILGIIFITDENIAHTETISIEFGQSLWSLADEYRGKMTKHEWIKHVEKMNQIDSKAIVAGSTIEIPVIKNAVYLNDIDKQDIVKVANR